MKSSAGLLLVCVLGMVLVAPPAYPQKVSERDLLQNLSVDMINVKATLKQMQEVSENKNAETTKLLQDLLKEVSTRFATIDTTVQKLNESLSGIKASDDKSLKDIQDARISLDALRKTVDEGFVQLNNKSNSLTREINSLKTAEQPLPGAGQVFQQAFGELEAGFPDLAIADFREFLKNYPGDLRAAFAQFYIGDALFSQKKYQEAQTELDKALENYPTSDKKCIALYRKGQTHAELKQTPQARGAYQSVVKECSGTQEAALAAADLKKLPVK